MFTRIIVFVAIATLAWVVWKKLRNLISIHSKRFKDSLSSQDRELKSEKLEKDPETGRYRPVNNSQK